MLKRAFRWLVIFVFVVTLLLVVSGVGIYLYVEHNQHRAVQVAAAEFGLDVTYARATPEVWSSFPRVSLRVDSVTVRDIESDSTKAALFNVRTLRAAFNLKKIWRDTLIWEDIKLESGHVSIVGDSTGTYNLGKLNALSPSSGEAANGESGYSLFRPYLDLNGIGIDIDDVHLSYVDPRKHKLMALRLDSVRTLADTLSNAAIRLETCLSAYVDGLSFNTLKGSYLKQQQLGGCFVMVKRDSAWVVDTTTLMVGPDTYRVAGDIGPAGLHLRIENDQLDYSRARALMHDTLQARLSKYDVSGPFAVVADVYKPPDGGNDVDLELRFRTNNQQVIIQQFTFEAVTTDGVFYNSLPVDLGGTPGSTTEFFIVTGPTTATYDGMLINSPKATVRGWPRDAYLHSPIDLSGSAAALARLFGNTEFFFTQGDFSMLTEVNASLNDVEQIINTSDGKLEMTNLRVKYAPSSVTLPVEQLTLDKRGNDVQFTMHSGRLGGGVDFTLVGYLDNILPLLLERPADSLKTEVIFHARRGDWSGFRQLFGNAGYFDQQTSESEPLALQVQRMKQTLLGIGNKFSPHLQMVIDTMDYYDILTLNDFRAGMKFRGNTLVLEKSRLDLPQGTLQLQAEVELGEERRTPFTVGVQAQSLNVDALRKPLTAFGLALPEGIQTLPTGLDIAFNHTGVINDSFGIQPGLNIGQLVFSDSRHHLFDGSITYEPGVDGLETNLLLEGDPAFVNDIFSSTDFFFGTGRFKLDLKTKGVPTDLEALLRQSDLLLTIDSSRVSYAPMGVFIPINKLAVDAAGDITRFSLTLAADSTRRTAYLSGEMDRLSAYLFPKAGAPFKLSANFSASRFHVEDVFELVQLEETPDTVIFGDTAGSDFDPQLILSTTEGIFQAFRPDLSLQIDTLQIAPETQFTDLSAQIRLLDSTLLIVEETGFTLGGGAMEVAATYSLDHQAISPFTLQWQADSLSVEDLERTLSVFHLTNGNGEHGVSGVVSSTGNIRGSLNETNWQLPIEETSGVVTLNLERGALSNQPALERLGRKLLMRKRFQNVLLGPLSLSVTLDSGRLSVPIIEVQSTALQLFVEGTFDTVRGPDLLISVPLRNIGRGQLSNVPPPTGYALAGRKVYLVVEPDALGESQMRFRLGRRKYYRDRGLLSVLKQRKQREKKARRQARRDRKERRRNN